MSEAPACLGCLRRAWLLAELSAVLDCRRGSPERLYALLELNDEELIAAVGGSRRAQLRARHAEIDAEQLAAIAPARALCRHSPHLRIAADAARWAPWMVALAGGEVRLLGLLRSPRVAVLSSRAATDYGRTVAASLARSLAAAGVTVMAGICGPIAQVTHGAVAEVARGSLGVLGHALAPRAGEAPSHRGAVDAIARRGCVVSELLGDGRLWGTIAAERILVGLADAVLLVEAEENPRELHAARFALTLGRPLAVVPGMLTNPHAAGPHALLAEGARMIRGAEEILDLLAESGRERPSPIPERRLAPLSRTLSDVLAAVGGGADTPERVAAATGLALESLAALGELESLGLVRRLPGCRWTCSDPVAPQSSSSARFQPTLSGR